MEERNLYLFLLHGVDDKYFCRSFFPEEKKDYTRNQASWKDAGVDISHVVVYVGNGKVVEALNESA